MHPLILLPLVMGNVSELREAATNLIFNAVDAMPEGGVITDLGMPYVDGNQVTLSIKEMFPATPVVLPTGWGRRMAMGDEAPAHVDFALPKPFDLNELRNVFAQLIEP